MYVGCYEDNADRDLEIKIWKDDEATPARCINDCFDGGYAFVGLQVGRPLCTVQGAGQMIHVHLFSKLV